MRKLYFAVASILFVFSACIKNECIKPARSAINEPPAIKVISPFSIPVLKPGDVLEVKAVFTDRDVVYVASWEALRAAGVCGTNPYSGQFEPKTSEYEMNFNSSFQRILPVIKQFVYMELMVPEIFLRSISGSRQQIDF